MLAIGSIQSTVKSQIDANAFFSAVPTVACIIDDGTQDGAIETQLRSKGFVIVLPNILKAGRRDLGGGRLALDAEFVVRVLANPHVNTAVGGANRNVYSAIGAVVSSVLSWNPVNAGDRKFEAAAEWLQLTTQDPGLMAYDLFFTKLSTLN
jgi:hypothetical protein